MSTDSDHVVWIWHAGRFWKYILNIYIKYFPVKQVVMIHVNLLLLTLSEYGFWGLKEREDIEEIENR